MAGSSVPILNIPWIEGVLAGDSSRPKFRLGEEVTVVDNKSVEGTLAEDQCAEGKHLSRPPSDDATYTAADLSHSALSDNVPEKQLSISVEQMSLAPSHDQSGFTSHNKSGFTPRENQKQATDLSTVDSSHIVDHKQKENQDEQAAEHDPQEPADKKIGAIGGVSEDDLDLGCLCASIAVVDVILRMRETAMHEFEEVVERIQGEEPQAHFTQHSMSWIGRLTDEHISERLGLLETDLAEETANNLHGEHSEHISAEMKIIMEYHITEALEETSRELQSILVIKTFLEVMIYHEYLASEQSSSLPFPEYIRELRWSDGSTVGLRKRCEVLLSHMVVSGLCDEPDDRAEYFIRNPLPNNLEGKYLNEGLELPLERWGGLDSLLHIREGDRIMKYLVNFILWVNSTYVVTDDPIRNTPLLCEIELSAEEQKIVEKIVVGEMQEGVVAVEKNMCFLCNKGKTELINVVLRPAESSNRLQHEGFVRWILKAVRKWPDASLAGKKEFVEDPEDHIIQVFDSDFYRLYHKYTGEVHPGAPSTTSSPSASNSQTSGNRKLYKRHVFLDIDGDDWMDMVLKFGYNAGRREQDIQPYRGTEALRFILATQRDGVEWNNDQVFHIPIIDRMMASGYYG
ncbi:hypothetical protein MMC30_008840 [Trapelia coarctata]|nr:hypothetical protein [Trapelia coarctata]